MFERLGIILQNIFIRKKLNYLDYFNRHGYACDCYITEYFKRCDCKCDTCKYSLYKGDKDVD